MIAQVMVVPVSANMKLIYNTNKWSLTMYGSGNEFFLKFALISMFPATNSLAKSASKGILTVKAK